MRKFEGFMAGVNLGGWLSQFRKADKEHFDSFIKEEDIIQIASWGMDHVRLPIDYAILEDDERPFSYREEGFEYIDRCIGWCKKRGLNIVLDLHRAAGYAFHSLGENRLFESEELKNRFVALWKEFARRYKEHGDNVAFELLNEMVEPDSSRWNLLIRRVVDAIREIDENRVIIIGGNRYNSVWELKNLDRLEDNRLVYTFHFYEPHIFTHQKARWEPEMKELDFTVPYPSGRKEYELYLKKSENFRQKVQFFETTDKDYLASCLIPALKFMEDRKVPLYCGEYGVIVHAPEECSINWHRDISSLLMEYGIGRAVWTYKLMDFPLVDAASVIINPELIRIVSKV
jgi:hypothetical protein